MFGNKKNEKTDLPDLEYFTIFDTKTSSYREPILAINRHDLLRAIQNDFSDPAKAAKNQHYQNAEDFQIFKVGEYDKKSGTITGVHHEHIANMHDIKAVALRSQKGPEALLST